MEGQDVNKIDYMRPCRQEVGKDLKIRGGLIWAAQPKVRHNLDIQERLE